MYSKTCYTYCEWVGFKREGGIQNKSLHRVLKTNSLEIKYWNVLKQSKFCDTYQPGMIELRVCQF